MDIQHLQNAIKMIETRDYNWRATWYNPLNKELRRKLRKQEKDTK